MRGIEQFLQVDAATLGALKYAGTWNASTNTPTLASGVGVQGQYYVVSVAGSTNLDGETNWQVGDWAVFNGSVWQKVDGGSTGLLTTLTVTGNTYLATTSGNVGVGTSSPVNTAGYGGLTLNGTSGAIVSMMENGTETFRLTNATGYSFVNTTGSTPLLFGTAATERMRITSAGDVGIGTSSPAVKLDVVGSINASSSVVINTTNGVLFGESGNSLVIAADNGNTGANTRLQFNVDGSERMRIDSAGNLGLAVAPSAWGLGKAIEVGVAGNCVWGVQNADLRLAANMYYDGANYRYVNNGISARYDVGNGSLGGHSWFTAPLGTAGNAISFTQAMTLDASSNLIVGTTANNPSARIFAAGPINTDWSSTIALRYNVSGQTNSYYKGMTGTSIETAQARGLHIFNYDADSNPGISFYPNSYAGQTANASMVLNPSGNLGLGVTPSNWQSSSGANWDVIDIGGAGALAFSPAGSNDLTLAANAYYDNTDSRWEYKNTGDKAARYSVTAGGTHVWYITNSTGTANNPITFTQAMTLNSGGNLMLGTTNAYNRIHVNGSGEQYIRVGAATGSDYRGYIISGTDGDSSAYGQLKMELSGGQMQLVAGASGFGGFLTIYTNGSERARITDGGWSKFSNTGTYASSTGAYHEVRSNQDGNTFVVGNTSTSTNTDGTIFIQNARNTTNNTYYIIGAYNTAAAAFKFRVADSGDVTNTNGTYGTISDAKMKTDIVDAGSQWDDIKAVRFRKFKMKDDPSGLMQLGVVAQELEQTSPGLVDEHADRDAEGNDLGTTTKSVKTSVLLMKAAVALQEAMTRIEQLEAKVAALETK